MLSIHDGPSLLRALNSPIDTRLKELLLLRRDQLGGDIAGLANYWIVQPGDTSAAVERAIGFSPFRNAVDGVRFGEPDFEPSWEWMEDHDGLCFEIVFIMDDSGFGHVLLVEKREGVAPELIRLCETFASEQPAVPAESES